MPPRGDERPLVVVGDTLLDVDLTGRSTRLCPDEPAPVVDETQRSARPGGAGLAAVLAARHRPVVLVTAIGDDTAGHRLRDQLAEHVTVIDLGAPHTVVKTRVRVDGRTLIRIDQVGPEPIDLAPDLPGDAAELIRGAATVLVSDYGLGATSHPGLRILLAATSTVVWDPHPRGAEPVPGVAVATPNVREAAHFSGVSGHDLTAVLRQGTALLGHWRAQAVAVTRGVEGVALCGHEAAPLVVPAQRVHAVDTCGAGDAFAAGTALGLADGEDLPAALAAGVRRAADFLVRGGVAGLEEPDPEPSSRTEDVVAHTRAAGGTVVMAGGCFDLLHAGHVAYLEAARSLGDCLIVALNSDDSVRDLKGPGRPLVPAQDRARVLEALACVDAVEVFEDSTPAAVLRRIQPDVFAKGGDYRRGTIPEADLVREYGGQVVVLPELVGRSSSRLVHAAHHAEAASAEVPAVHRTEEEQCHTRTA
jgi:D-beta-D-heptose 7-phosphate kinase/D-beta-D-heptose 1-phosphate adenosyltransferase